MFITIENVYNAFLKWVESTLIVKGTITQKAIITFMLLQSKDKIMKMIVSLSAMVVDKDKDKLDYQKLVSNLKQTLEKIGGTYTIPLINYTFDGQDLQIIINNLREYLIND